MADEADEAGYARERPRRRELKLLAATIAQSQWPRRASTRMKASKHTPGQREREREGDQRKEDDGWMDGWMDGYQRNKIKDADEDS